MSTLLMVSGASRGLGQAVAVAFAAQWPSSMEAVLLARSPIDATREAMQAARRNSNRMDDMQIQGYEVDLGNLDTLEGSMDPIWKQHASETTTRQHSILVNCAGTTGAIGKLPTSLRDIRQAADLNLTSKVWLSTQFIQHYHNHPNHQTTIINVSSMCAVKPTPTMALYCATSAGREIFHTVLAADHKDDSNMVRILNYAPGSCNTDMQAQLRAEPHLDPAVQAYCHGLLATNDEKNGGLVECADTATYLVQRVLEADFDSGERLEFVDASTYKY